jgi:hypothetical protein
MAIEPCQKYPAIKYKVKAFVSLFLDPDITIPSNSSSNVYLSISKRPNLQV